MTLRRPASLVALLALVTAAHTNAAERYSTDNFTVEASTKDLARKFGDAAEAYRKEKALEWLGREMPRWPARCPLKVRVDAQQGGGATTFEFQVGRLGIQSQEMEIFGTVPQMLESILPHEVTHTVFAHHFGQAVPRWADEGGSVLSENDNERFKHDVRCRQLLNEGKGIPLKALFSLKNYPPDTHTLYAQGYSVSQFLVDKGGTGGKQKFLEFVGVGLKNGNRNWNEAAKLYGYDSADDLQLDWIDTLKNTAPQRIARGPAKATPAQPGTLTAARGPETRTSQPGVPLLEAPIVARGQAPATPVSIGTTPRAATPPAAPTPPATLRLLPPEVPSQR